MKQKLILFLLLTRALVLQSQNIISNPSFENYTFCPQDYTERENRNILYSWKGCQIIDDPNLKIEEIEKNNRRFYIINFHNYCSFKLSPRIPPHHGQGYVSNYSLLFNDFGNESTDFYTKESIRGVLYEPLKPNKKYIFWHWVALHPASHIAIDAFKIHFSVEPIPAFSNNIALFPPQISNPRGNIIDKPGEWVKIGGSFIANGGEKYILFGTYPKGYSKTTEINIKEIQKLGYQSKEASYLVDDLHLYQCDRLIDLGPAEDTIFCNGSMDIGYYIPGAIYLWENGDTKAIRTISEAGTYWVEVRLDDCVTRDTIRLAVSDKRVPYTLGPDRYLCQGDTFWLEANAQQPIIWSTGSSHDIIPIFRPGIYWIQAMKNGCPVRDTIRIIGELPPGEGRKEYSRFFDAPLCRGTMAYIGWQAKPGENYRWNDGVIEPIRTVSKPGTYILTISKQACVVKDTFEIAYKDCLDFIPNVITPNGDDINDDFEIDGIQEDIWELRVLNRWGQTVFYSPDYRNNWGREAQPGLYYYHLRNLQHGDEHKGWLTVLKE